MNKRAVRKSKSPRFKCGRKCVGHLQSIRIKKRQCSVLKKKLLKSEGDCEKLKENNYALARKLEEVKNNFRKFELDRDACTLLDYKKKIKVYEKNILVLNDIISNSIFPFFLKSSEELAKGKMILRECMAEMETKITVSGNNNNNYNTSNNNNNRVHQVVPMVKGVSIHKSFVPLRRFQLNGLQNHPSPIAEEAENQSVNIVQRRTKSRLGRRNASGSSDCSNGRTPGTSATVTSSGNTVESDRGIETTFAAVSNCSHSLPVTGTENLQVVLSPISEVNPYAVSSSSATNEDLTVSDNIVNSNNNNSNSNNNNRNSNNNVVNKRRQNNESSCEKKRKVDEENINPLEGSSWMHCDFSTSNNSNVKTEKNFNKKVNKLDYSCKSNDHSFSLSNITIRKKDPTVSIFKLPSTEDSLIMSDSDENTDDESTIHPSVILDSTSITSVHPSSNISGTNNENRSEGNPDQNEEEDIENDQPVVNDESSIDEEDVIDNSRSESSPKDKIKQCYVPIIGSVPDQNCNLSGSVTPAAPKKSNNGLSSSSSTNSINVRNVVVSLARADDLQNNKKPICDTSSGSITGKKGDNSKKKNQGKLKRLTSQEDEMVKENVPDSRSTGKNRRPENHNCVSNERFLSVADSNLLAESRHENSSLYSDSSELLLSSVEEKRSLRNRGKVKCYKEPDMKSKKRRD